MRGLRATDRSAGIARERGRNTARDLDGRADRLGVAACALRARAVAVSGGEAEAGRRAAGAADDRGEGDELMGWEWHERRRRNGRFVSDLAVAMSPPRMDQLHIRCPFDLAQQIRRAARDEAKELTSWILDACKVAIVESARRTTAEGPAERPKTATRRRGTGV